MKKPLIALCMAAGLIFSAAAIAAAASEPRAPEPFVSGSLERILQDKAGQPFMLVLWSKDCSSCLKEMKTLSSLEQANPKLNLVFLATDDQEDADTVASLLAENGFSAAQSWVFADSNAQRLRYEIDPGWYGELPRTYFYDASHNREGISGLVDEEKLQAWVNAVAQ